MSPCVPSKLMCWLVSTRLVQTDVSCDNTFQLNGNRNRKYRVCSELCVFHLPGWGVYSISMVIVVKTLLRRTSRRNVSVGVSLQSCASFFIGRSRRVWVTAGREKATRARMAMIQAPQVIIRNHAWSPGKR